MCVSLLYRCLFSILSYRVNFVLRILIFLVWLSPDEFSLFVASLFNCFMLIEPVSAFATPVRLEAETFITHFTLSAHLVVILIRMPTQAFYIKIGHVFILSATTFLYFTFRLFPVSAMLLKQVPTKTAIRTCDSFALLPIHIQPFHFVASGQLDRLVLEGGKADFFLKFSHFLYL